MVDIRLKYSYGADLKVEDERVKPARNRFVQ